MYYIPRLRSHIIILGQLDESGCQVLIQNGVLRVRDRERRLLAKGTESTKSPVLCCVTDRAARVSCSAQRR